MRDFDAVLLNHCIVGQAAVGLLRKECVAVSVLHNDLSDIYHVGLSNWQQLDAIVAVSKRVQDQAFRLGVPEERIKWIRNGIMVPPSWPKQGGFSSAATKLKLIFLGRVDHGQKGIFYVPSILRKITEKCYNVSLDVVGEGEPFLTDLRAQMRDRCPNVMVTYHGAMQNAAAMEILAGMDVLLMPSHYEGQPIAPLEAMARGVVPVVTDLPGITDELIRHRGGGISAPVSDIDAFAEAVIRLTDPAVRAQMSLAAWETVRERFTAEGMCREYAFLLDKLAKDRSVGNGPKRTGQMNMEVLGKYARLPNWALRMGRKGMRVKRALRRVINPTSPSGRK